MEKLYVIVRQDLPAGLLLAQVGHAVQAMNDQHPDVIASWADGNLVVLGVGSAKTLSELHCSLCRQRVATVIFCEPDRDGEPTAVAAGDSAITRRLVSSLPLALRPCRPSPSAAA